MTENNPLESLQKLRYGYSLAVRYHKNLKNLLAEIGFQKIDKFIEIGVLTNWNDSYYFNKDRADQFEEFLLQ